MEKAMEGTLPGASRGIRRARSEAQRERDLVDIAERYLHGWRQSEIAAWLSEDRGYAVAASTLSTDIQELHSRWMRAQLLDFDAAKSKELERVDVLERAYWEGYERSMRERSEFYQEQVRDEQMGEGKKVRNNDVRKNLTEEVGGEDEGESGGTKGKKNIYTRTKTKVRKAERDGSVAFLQGVERCIGLRCQILGLNAPAQLNINWRKDAKQAGVDPEKLKRDMVRQLVGAAKEKLMDVARAVEGIEDVNDPGEVVEGTWEDAEEDSEE